MPTTSVHTQREGWVKLTAKSSKGKISISISDSGQRKDQPEQTIIKRIIEENFGSLYTNHSGPHQEFVIEFPTAAMVK